MNSKSVIVIGFNTRPLVYSLYKAGYIVYAVDFFGDLDLFPYVKDSISVIRELDKNYDNLRDKYSTYLTNYALSLIHKYQDTNFLLIGSGLDDAYKERKIILDEIQHINIKSLNNKLEIIKKARDIEYIYNFLNSQGIKTPFYFSLNHYKLKKANLKYPFILKKKRSAGGINVFKIKEEKDLFSQIKILEKKSFIPSEWMAQEYINGIPVSCTVISDGNECEIISINRQIIGEDFLNSPKEFMYCGNIVPAGLSEKENEIISKISIALTLELKLKGINGFDYVLKDNNAYLMECNPRIPGSISASESSLGLNLLDLHIKSFFSNEWINVKNVISSIRPGNFTTKLVFFAPKSIQKKHVIKINKLNNVYDKPEPNKDLLKGEPLCTVLYKANSLSKSFNGAKKIIKHINRTIS